MLFTIYLRKPRENFQYVAIRVFCNFAQSLVIFFSFLSSCSHYKCQIILAIYINTISCSLSFFLILNALFSLLQIFATDIRFSAFPTRLSALYSPAASFYSSRFPFLASSMGNKERKPFPLNLKYCPSCDRGSAKGRARGGRSGPDTRP